MVSTCTEITANTDAGQCLYTVPVEHVTNHGLTAHSELNTVLM